MSGIVGKNLGRGSGVVTAAPVGADTVSGASIVDDAIDSEHYVDGSIDNAHVADNAIDSEHYAAGSIDLEHMSSESVDEDNLHISNSGSNGNFLSKQSGDTGGLTWAAVTTDLSGDSSPQLGGFLDANGNYIQMQKGGDISSASPTVIDTDGDYFAVTGTTNFSAFTVAADRHFFLEFGAVLTMTHGNGTLDLPGAANITTAASDVGEFVSTAANVVTCVNYTKRDGTAVVAAGGGFTLGSETATTTGTSVTFGSLPTGTKAIHLLFNGVSQTTDDNLLLQLGDAGGIETSGYVSSSMSMEHGANPSMSSNTSGFILKSADTAGILDGTVSLYLLNSSTFSWVESGAYKIKNLNMGISGGTKSLSAELTQVKLGMLGGAFDAGSVNILYS
jgi:hypothetical protein